MTTAFKWLNNRYVIAWALAFWTAIDLILIGVHCDLSKSDWGTWVGSLGTVATLVGTIVLATDESRRRRQVEMNIADLRAMEMWAELQVVRRHLRGAHTIATAVVTKERGDPNLLETLGELISAIPSWTLDDALPFTVYVGDVSKNLANLFILLRNTKRLTELNSRNRSTVDERMSQAQILLEPLSYASQQVSNSLQVLSQHVRLPPELP
jgi:hypothetical protein